MKKLMFSTFLLFVVATVAVSGCAPASSISVSPTDTPAPMLPTFTPELTATETQTETVAAPTEVAYVYTSETGVNPENIVNKTPTTPEQWAKVKADLESRETGGGLGCNYPDLIRNNNELTSIWYVTCASNDEGATPGFLSIDEDGNKVMTFLVHVNSVPGETSTILLNIALIPEEMQALYPDNRTADNAWALIIL